MSFERMGKALDKAYGEYYTAKLNREVAVRDYNKGRIEKIPEDVVKEYGEAKEKYMDALTEAVKALMGSI